MDFILNKQTSFSISNCVFFLEQTFISCNLGRLSRNQRRIIHLKLEMAANTLVNVLAIAHSFIRHLRDDILSPAYNDLRDKFGSNQCIVHFLHEGTILPDYDRFL